MATDCPAGTVKLTSSKMFKMPEASFTRLQSLSTSIALVTAFMNSFSQYRRRISLGVLGLSLWPVLTKASSQINPQKSSSLQRILVVGDSLSAEYGLKRGSGWVDLLKVALAPTHPQIEIINASISGDTTSGGLSRLKTLLERSKPTIVIIELGANDALRGLPLEMTQRNLLEMLQLVKQTGARAVIAGMQIPPNYGREYTTAFKELFRNIAQKEHAAFIPFFLEGIAENPAMFQADTIHPNEQAQPILMDNVRKVLEPMLVQSAGQ